MVATASLDKSVRLWDIRGARWTGEEKGLCKPLVTLPTKQACNSAFFSPDGARLATVSLANEVNVWSYHELAGTAVGSEDDADAAAAAGKKMPKFAHRKPAQSMRHDNHTGRWLTRFTAKWDGTNPQGLAVGCKLQPRRVDVLWSPGLNGVGSGRLGRVGSPGLEDEELASVCSCVAFHPSMPFTLAGANSSGYVYVWENRS